MGRKKYTKEIIDYILKIKDHKTSAYIAEKVNAKFHTNFTISAICSYMADHRIKTNLNPWKAHETIRWCDIGTEKSKNNYIYIKTAQPNVWRLKHYVNYELATGKKVEKSQQIIFLDNNTRNCDITNLYIVSRRIMRILNSHFKNWKTSDPQKNLTYIYLAKIKAAEIDRGKAIGRINKVGALEYEKL